MGGNTLDEYKGILKDEGLSGKDACEMMGGMSYGSYRSMTRKNLRGRSIPKWVRAFIFGYRLGKGL